MKYTLDINVELRLIARNLVDQIQAGEFTPWEAAYEVLPFEYNITGQEQEYVVEYMESLMGFNFDGT